MNTVLRLTQYQIRDVLRSRWAIVYAVFVVLYTELLIRFTAGTHAALLGVGSVAQLLVPLVTMLFGALYIYGARPFHELLLTQPVTRTQLFAGSYLGLGLPLALAFVVGAALPFLFHGIDETASVRAVLVVLLIGLALTLVFLGVTLLASLIVDDRLKGIAAITAVWLVVCVLYDSIVLLAVGWFRDYPLERPLVMLMLLNPVDLARVVLLLETDTAALMGYTGAVLRRTLGGSGRYLAAAALAVWICVPPLLAWRVYRRKDL